MKKLLMFVAIIALTACTDAKRAKWAAYNEKATITCYSGGVVIYKGRSTGKVLSEQGSDGYFFSDSATHTAHEVSGECVVIYDK